MGEERKYVNSKLGRKMKQSRFNQFNPSQKGKNKNKKAWKIQNHLAGRTPGNYNNVLSWLITRQRLSVWVNKSNPDTCCLHKKFLKWQRNMENEDEKCQQILANKYGTVILTSGWMKFNVKSIIKGKLKHCL